MSRFMRRTGWYLLGDLIIVVIAYRVALTGRFAGASPNEHYLQAWNTYCLLYTSPSPRDTERSRMPSSA